MAENRKWIKVKAGGGATEETQENGQWIKVKAGGGVKAKTTTPKKSQRQQLEDELAQLRKSYTPGGAFGGRTQEDKDTLHRIQYLENQLSRAKSEDYYQTALKRLSELDEETIGYLDQLREGGTPKAAVEMQGIADNRSWEEIYAEQYQMDESVKKALLDKGYTEEQIAQYVKDRTRQANRENYEAEVAKSRAEADNGVIGAVTASAKSVPQNLTGGLGYLSLASQRAHNALRGYDEPLDYYTPEMVGQAKAQAARQTVSQKLEENTELSTALTGNVASFLYNTGMSMADSAAIATMTAVGVPPAVGTAFLGGTAATQATVAAKERGVSDERALLTGLAAGTAEAFFEKVSLDKLLSTSPTEGLLRQRVMQGLKNMGVQGTVEGSEELATSLANAITDALINGGQSEYNQKVQDYMAQGKSAEEADRLATKDFVLNLGADFLGGFISGGTMSIGADSARNSAYKSAYGENAQELTDEALEIDPKNETALYAKKRLEQGKSVSGAVLRSLVSQNQRKIDADSASAAEAAEETGEATQDTTEVSEGAEAKRTAVSPIAHNTEFTEEEARYIVEEGAKEFGNAASSVVNSYMRGQDPQMYMAQAKLVFNYGKTMSEEKGIPYALNSPLLKSMDETQIRSLFNAGRMQAKAIPVTAVKGKGEVVLTGGIDYNLLSPVQQTQYNALAAFAKATGYTIELFESAADEEGRYAAELGRFDPSTGVIRIDINAGRDKVDDLTNYAMVRVASHEITHSFKKNAPQQYVALRDYVTGILADKGDFKRLVDKKMRELGVGYETAVDEVVADGCEMMLRNTHFAEKLARENRTLFEKIRDAIHDFFMTLRAAFKGVETSHEEAKLLKDAENLQKLWDEALARSVENVAAAELAEAGIAVNEETESGSLYSVRDVLSDTEQKKVAKMLVKQFGVTEAEAMSWLKAETSMASLILNPKYSMYLDYEGDPNEVAIKQNSDYPQGTVDFSNICKKRREFTQVMNRILRNFPNHVFAATDLAKIRTIMGREGMTLPCGICYVEDRRQLDTIVAQDFIDSLKAYREGSKTRPNGKPFNPNQLKGLQMTDGDTYVPSIYELVTLEGRNALKAKNPNMEAAWVKYNNARGMQAVRLLTNEAEYKRQILKYSPKTVQSKNDHGGLRIYSFSDAEMFHLIDIVQVITDSAAVGLKIQGYTKVNEYAKAVRNTGLKLNRSLIPAGDLGYHMEDGRVALDYDPVEGIDIHHRDFFDSTDNPNVGNIVIGINDTQIRAAMVSDFVDMVIPFHTGQSEDVLGEKGIAAWENYKDYQTEKDIATGKTSKHQINIYTEVIQAAEQEGNPIRNKRQFVEKFLAVCKANGLKPRFAQFLNTDAEGNYVYTEGYHKFLVDFKMFAQTAEGEYLPQMVVKPIFDDAYVTGILKSYVEEQQTKDAEVAKQMPRVIERITDEIIKPEGVAESGDVMYSKRGYQQRFFPGNVFPAGREHSAAIRWAESQNVSVGDRKLMLYNGNYYLIEVFSDMDFGYLVMKKYTKDNYREELAEYGEIDIGKSLQSEFNEGIAHHRKKAEHARGGYRADPSQSGYRGEDRAVYGMDADENGRRDDSGEAERDRADGGGDQRGTGVNYSFRTGYIPTDSSILTSYVPTDSEGRQLSAEQQEYFRDSKVRGKSGSLMVMYHGTANGGGFTVFDGDKLGNETRTTQLGQGFYFTNVKKEAEAYTNNVDIYGRASRGTNPYLHKVYLNITNPFDVKTDTLDINAAKAVYMDGTYAYFFDEWIPFYMNKKTLSGRTFTKADVQAMSKEERVSVYVDYLSQLGAKEVLSNMVRAFPYGKQGALLASMQNRLGYDGLVEEFKPGQFQYVAFSSEQVKATDNLTPTAHLDIRYSFRTGYIPTDRSILASYVPTDSDSDMVKRHIAEYQQNVQQLRDLEQTLREQREQLRSLTGDGNKKQRAALRDEIIKTQNRIQIASDQLLRKEKWMGVRTVLNREKDALVKQAKAEESEKLKKYRAQRWDTENRRKLRERISYRVKTLDKMLREPTNDKHIPDGLQGAILDFCEAFTENTSVFPKKRLDSIRAEYAALESKASETNLADLYDESIKEMLEYLSEVMSGKRLSELNVEQLSMVKAIADHFAFMVKNENEIFVHGRKVKLDETAQGVIAAAKGHNRRLPEIAKTEWADAADKFLTSGNLRPVYFFRDKGSDMEGLFQSLLDAQSEYAFRMEAAMQFVEETEKATGYSEWGNSEETLTLTNSANQQVTLNLQQAMSLLATYERELQSGNLLHVTQGGFLYEKDVTGDITVKGVKVPVIKQVVQAEKAKAHPMSAEGMDKVRTWLGEIDPRVLDYMGKMVEYLSTTMADYGNETSMQLHGYKKFGEGYYWPIKSAEEFLQQEPGKAGFDESRWKHKGFTKATVKGANNPFVLRGFVEVWSNHVSQMCMYSTMAVPQDAFVRVMNYKTQVDPTGSTASESVKSEIRSNYGQKALAYIDTYLSDINGGLLTDPRAGALNRLVSLFKKNAVFGSASVALQQYSAVIRAMVYLDPKYFVRNAGWKKTQEAFERAKRYSGVAIIKEIGGFDTTTGRSGANWLMERDPTELKDKARALFQFGEKDTGYRDRLLTALPAKMDKVGWGHIWIAAENEIADTTDLERGTDAFYEAVAKRFEEVIELTQVYDSVLTRSENMRGKDGLIKAATSFMAEPTVTMNMFVTAAQDAIAGKDGAKARLAKTAFVLAMSVIVNNILKALATAGRDKDEDQTIVEKYVEDVVGGIISDVNPFGYVPILRDIKSIWEGYSVEASYAAVISDVYDAWTKWEKNQTVESGFDVLNAVAALFGIPAKNLKRDIMAVLDTFLETAPLSESSKRGFWNATREGLGIMPGVDDKMMEAFEADRKGNEKARKKALDEITRLYEDKAKQYRLEGKEEPVKKAKSSLKSTITSVLKPLYQAAKTQTEKNRIKSLALRVYVGGEQLYNGYDFERYWGED